MAKAKDVDVRNTLCTLMVPTSDPKDASNAHRCFPPFSAMEEEGGQELQTNLL